MKNSLSSLKWYAINHSQINYDQNTDEFQQVNYNRERKRMSTNDKVERFQARTITNSNINNNCNNVAASDNPIRTCKHALDYTSEYHYQLIKIECEPKLRDQRGRPKFIQAFLNYIKVDFLKQNVAYTKPLLFDLWWIDMNGNIQIISKAAKIIVYLSQTNRYPKELKNIKLTPFPPKHLPPKHTAELGRVQIEQVKAFYLYLKKYTCTWYKYTRL